jgi:hypothetical protein
MLIGETMDKRIQIWTMFHDGDITVVSGEGTPSLCIFVSIPYLRRRLFPLGDSFIITLTGVTVCEFRNFDETLSTLTNATEMGQPQILSTDSDSMPIKIDTTMGQLLLDFESISFGLDTGQCIDYEVIKQTSEEYWAEWSAKAPQASAKDTEPNNR